MGQRLQAFLIAKVVPHGGGRARYRCIAAPHYQKCACPIHIRSVCRLLTLLRQPGNARIVREELASIAGKYGPYMREETLAPRIPCPFAAYLLNVAFSCDVYEPYAAPGSFGGVLDAKMSCWGDNNTGITVIDVTDPEDAAYGFFGSRGSPTVDSLFDESGEDAFDSGDDDPNSGAEDSRRIGGGAGRDRWEVSAAEAEGDAGFVTDSDEDEDDLQQASSQLWQAKVVKDLDLEDRENQTAAQAPPISGDIPSLLSLTIGPAVMQVLESGDYSSIEPVLLQSDKHPHFLAVFRQIPGPFPDKGLALVQRIFDEMGGRVDLSSVQLSAEQLVRVLNRDTYEEIDLSGNTQLTRDTFPHLLASLPPTRRLVLFRTSISVNDMQKLLLNQTLFRNVQELIHPATHNWTDANNFPEAFTVDVYQDSGICSKNAVCLPLCSPTPIAQNLIMLLELMLSDNFLMMFHFDYAMLDGNAALEAVFGTALLPEGRSWSEREVSCTPCPPSGVKPNEGGWRFLLEFDKGLPHRAKYGFPTAKGPLTRSRFYVYDLPGFLARLEKDGKPPLPPALEEKLREAFDRLSKRAKLMSYRHYKARCISAARKVMTWESVNGVPWH
ncbi:hypothetical protein EV715DRAFT_208770 [Schizophyllum commune]